MLNRLIVSGIKNNNLHKSSVDSFYIHYFYVSFFNVSCYGTSDETSYNYVQKY